MTNNIEQAIGSILGIVIAFVIAVPLLWWAIRRDMEERMRLPKGALKRKNRR